MFRIVTRPQLILIVIIILSVLFGAAGTLLFQKRHQLTQILLKKDELPITPTSTPSPPKPEELIQEKQVEYFVNDILSASPSSELTNKTIIKAMPITSKTGTDWIVEASDLPTQKCKLADNCDQKSYYYSNGKAVDVTVRVDSSFKYVDCHVFAINNVGDWKKFIQPEKINLSEHSPILFIQQSCSIDPRFNTVYQLIDFRTGELIAFRDATGTAPKNMIDVFGQVRGNTFVNQYPYGSTPFILFTSEKRVSDQYQNINSYPIFRLNLSQHTIDKHIVF